ncbi:MAG: hypothetical protein H8M99_12095 [Gloeobacteraceae cyanobacterium ES-bin-144]|nr:hypothetical protein [Verrucomicrobiales bacterium]
MSGPPSRFHQANATVGNETFIVIPGSPTDSVKLTIDRAAAVGGKLCSRLNSVGNGPRWQDSFILDYQPE